MFLFFIVENDPHPENLEHQVVAKSLREVTARKNPNEGLAPDHLIEITENMHHVKTADAIQEIVLGIGARNEGSEEIEIIQAQGTNALAMVGNSLSLNFSMQQV